MRMAILALTIVTLLTSINIHPSYATPNSQLVRNGWVIDNGLNRFYVNGAWISDIKIVKPMEIDYGYYEAAYPWLPGFAIQRSEVLLGPTSEDFVFLLVLSNGLKMERHIIISDSTRYASIIDLYGNPTNDSVSFTAEYDTEVTYYTDSQYKLPGVHAGSWFSVTQVQLVSSQTADYVLARTYNESASSDSVDAPHDAIAAGQRPFKIIFRWWGIVEMYYQISVRPGETKRLTHYVVATPSDAESETLAKQLEDSDAQAIRPLNLTLHSFSAINGRIFLTFSLNDWFGYHVSDANVSVIANGHRIQATDSGRGYTCIVDLSDLISVPSLTVTAHKVGYGNTTNTIELNLTELSGLYNRFNLLLIYAAGTTVATALMVLLLVGRKKSRRYSKRRNA